VSSSSEQERAADASAAPDNERMPLRKTVRPAGPQDRQRQTSPFETRDHAVAGASASANGMIARWPERGQQYARGG